MSDQQILEQVKMGNKIAFGELYNRYWEGLFNFGYDCLHDEEATKDVIQDVFLSIWKNREKTEITHIKAYLFQSVKYGVMKSIKAEGLKASDLDYLSDEPAANPVEETVYFNETQEKLLTLMKSLPKRSREVFYLSRFEHLTNAQIAKQLNMSKSTVEWHISQALKAFRRVLSPKVSVWVWPALLLLQVLTLSFPY